MTKLGLRLAAGVTFTAILVVGSWLAAAGATTDGTRPGGAAASSGSKKKLKPFKAYPNFGKVEQLDPKLDALVPHWLTLEKLAGGFQWSEGPVWDRRSQSLLFSDIPRNVIFQWKEGLGTRDYLLPSGYTGKTPRSGESGSNGLTLDSQGRLVFCAHGDRCVERIERDGSRTILARYYLNRRFNSPNDLVYKSNGDLYFTDPPYGLEGGNGDLAKELAFSGVYLLRASGELVLLTSELTFPNGIAFAPDERTLYISVSDPNRPVIMAYHVRPDGTLEHGRVFFDAAPLVPGRQGLPDGMKLDESGNLFATGPGGVLVISPDGKHLGTINTGEKTANCAWGDDGRTLYITANMYLCRIRTITKGRVLGSAFSEPTPRRPMPLAAGR